MEVDIRLIKKKMGMSIPYKTTESLAFEEFNLLPDLEVDLKLSNVGERIILEGRILGGIKLTCDRCLEDFQWKFDLNVREEFMEKKKTGILPGDNEALDVEEELNVFLYENDVVDLKEAIRQNIIANIPIKPLCGPDCKGICPVCGSNNNVSECSCDREEAGIKSPIFTARGRSDVTSGR